MDKARVVEVLGADACGSGYLVADRLVLTAAHVLRGRDRRFGAEAEITFLSGRTVPAVQRWLSYDGPSEGIDATLLEWAASQFPDS